MLYEYETVRFQQVAHQKIFHLLFIFVCIRIMYIQCTITDVYIHMVVHTALRMCTNGALSYMRSFGGKLFF